MAGPENQGTEAPTPRRREMARDDGQVVFSTDLTASVTLFAGCVILMWTGSALLLRLQNAFYRWFTDVPTEEWGQHHVTVMARWMLAEVFSTSGLLLGSLLAAGLIFGFAQAGFHVSFKSLAVRWDRLLPENGWSRILSVDSGIRGLLNAAKVTLLLTVTSILLWIKRSEFSVLNYNSAASVAAAAWSTGLMICLAMAGVLIGLAIIDYLVKWFRNEKKLMMTREELKQENKDDQGDPHIRAAMRKRQRDARRRQSVKDVPKASLIITNPTHLAIAVQYEPGMAAPRIVAKGAGEFAKNIVRIARGHQIPVIERKPLARALFWSVDVGQEIPVEFFRAVAELLGEIYRARRSAA